MSATNICLLIIDPQFDFCYRTGSLFVPGADKDMKRLGDLIKKAAHRISKIYISLDSHEFTSIFHPCWFVDEEGNNPEPFTVITTKQIEKGVWIPFFVDMVEYTYDYIADLETAGKPHFIWPYHCLMSASYFSEGRSMVPSVSEAVHYFDRGNFGDVSYINKGMNGCTEQFSIFKAELPLEEDPATQFNRKLLDDLESYDLVLVSGEAGSHCVAESLKDMYDNFTNKDSANKIILISDTVSPVKGFASVQREAIKLLKTRGLRCKHSTNILKYINSIWHN